MGQQQQAAGKAPEKPVRWPIYSGFIVLILASAGLMVVVGMQSWQELRAGPEEIRVVLDGKEADAGSQVAADIRAAFDSYRDRVDNLQKLIATLIGLSSLYAIVLAVTGYLNGQTYLKQLESAVGDAEQKLREANEQLGEAKATSAELKKKFNAFAEAGRNLKTLADTVSEILPDKEARVDSYETLPGDAKQRIYFCEKSLAFAQFLSSDADDPVDELVSQAFLSLGRFYRVRFKSENARAVAEAAGTAEFRADLPQAEWTSRRREIFSLLERALLYAEMSVDRAPKEFCAWTELGITRMASPLTSAKAAEAFEKSLALHPRQQKALYWSSILQHRRGDYAGAETTLSKALDLTSWEDKDDPDRRSDLYYNRACARSRLAAAAKDPVAQAEYAKGAIEDLEIGCPRANGYSAKILRDDCEAGSDLEYVATRYRDRIAIVLDRLVGRRPAQAAAGVTA